MVNKLSGVYPTIDTLGFVPDVARTREAIALVGTASGAGLPAANMFSSSNPNGYVYEFNSFSEAKNTLGLATGSGAWTGGTFGSGAGATATFDGFNSAIRSLELIYLGNPSAKVYVAILSGAYADPLATPDGASEALTALLKKKDVGFLDDGGLEFNSDFSTHAQDADSQANGAERIYVGGVSMNEAFSGSSAGSGYLDVFDVSKYVALQESLGRAICFVGNSKYTFTAVSGTALEVEIGGNMLASYVAGRLSAVSEKTSILAKSVGRFLPYYNGKRFDWSQSQLEANYDNSMLSVRYDATAPNPFHFEKAMTFVPKTSAWGKITRRRIVDRVTRDTRALLKAEIGEDNTDVRRKAAENRLKRLLRGLIAEGLIKNRIAVSVYVFAGDEANGIARANVTVTPVTETEEYQLTIGVDLNG